MFELLLYIDMNCTESAKILERIAIHERLSNEVKVELIDTVQEATPHCDWDAHD